ncbi:MAG TPA: heterodisulfide reductase-related iron-sulfur binding cluster [Streptosporangiaceae bacterium]|nr:heterodisulfide reductase-related iron-sulfur binding cluster [Streptosporangiaceae bacterium]
MTADDTGIVEPIAHDDPVRSALDPDGSLRDLAGDCVHCGFCLPACPTYQLWGEEMDSPRGRIHLITQILDSGQGSAAAAEHFDRCLGCMACVTACPSGVQYGQLIEAARDWGETSKGQDAGIPAPLPARSLRDRAVRAAIFATFPYPNRLRVALGPLRAAQRTGLDRLAARSTLLRRVAPEAAAALAVAPAPPPPAARGGGVIRRSRHETPPAAAPRRLPARVPARGKRRAVVGMLTGCVQQVLFPQVNAATARVLSAEGCDVIVPRRQGCCGALSLHGGRRAEAADFARATIEAFERAGVDAVIVNAAGCGSAMKEYGHLLASDPDWAVRASAFSANVRDFSEFLADLGPVAPRAELAVTAAYHDACHLGHAQRITAQPRALLRGVPGLVLAEVADAGTCCGSAGIYNLVQPEAAAELGERKARAVASTGADLLVSANPGCSLQIAQALAAAGQPMPVAHVAEVLDASIRGLPVT